MSSLLSKAGVRSAARPPAAIQLTSAAVIAAVANGAGQPPTYAQVPLPADALVASIAEANLRRPAQVAAALNQLLDAARPSSRAVTVIVPDAAVRIFVLDFDALPTRAAEVSSVLRFRLRKMVPFDVEHAAISHQLLSESRTEIRVLVAVMPASVRSEYEAVIRQAGYEPGALLPATLATLAALQVDEPSLVACLDNHALSTAIVRGNDLVLYRSLELPLGDNGSEIARGIAVAAAFFEDHIGRPPARIHYAGPLATADFAALVEFPVVPLVPEPATGAVTALAHTSVAAVTGALQGAL